MLAPYFAFGIPIFLWVLYLFFERLRKKNNVHYLGLILLLISLFMASFSFQVLQSFWAIERTAKAQALPYPAFLLWLPFGLGILLSLLNTLRTIKRLHAFVNKSS